MYGGHIGNAPQDIIEVGGNLWSFTPVKDDPLSARNNDSTQSEPLKALL
jgi:hypothetical protein